MKDRLFEKIWGSPEKEGQQKQDQQPGQKTSKSHTRIENRSVIKCSKEGKKISEEKFQTIKVTKENQNSVVENSCVIKYDEEGKKIEIEKTQTINILNDRDDSILHLSDVELPNWIGQIGSSVPPSGDSAGASYPVPDTPAE